MPAAQPGLFEFSDGSKLKPIVTTDAPWSVDQTAVDLATLKTVAQAGRVGSVCHVLGKEHHPIKLNVKPSPDQTYWCTGCAVTGLPAPEKKPWEN